MRYRVYVGYARPVRQNAVLNESRLRVSVTLLPATERAITHGRNVRNAGGLSPHSLTHADTRTQHARTHALANTHARAARMHASTHARTHTHTHTHALLTLLSDSLLNAALNAIFPPLSNRSANQLRQQTV